MVAGIALVVGGLVLVTTTVGQSGREQPATADDRDETRRLRRMLRGWFPYPGLVR
jgi:hypothetical protein